MKEKLPKIYKNKIENIKSNIQNEFYYRSNSTAEDKRDDNNVKVDKSVLLMKIDNIFKRPDYVYQKDIIIMFKDGKNIEKKIIGRKDNYIITFDGQKIYLDDILDIK